jgi:hypothetical protein
MTVINTLLYRTDTNEITLLRIYLATDFTFSPDFSSCSVKT